MQVGIWIRVSTEMQVEGDSPQVHEARARAYAEGKAWEVATVYRLEAVSGKSVLEHPEAKRMMEDIRSGRIKALIFSKLARLARNTRELLFFSDFFQAANANLVSLGESIDTTSPAGRLYFTLIAALTQWEREEIAARVAAAVPERAKLGKPLGGAAPFGFQWKDGQLVLEEAEAPVRALMYELFLKERKKKTVARTMNERGYRTRNGSQWTSTSVSRLLQDSTAKGLRLSNYTQTTDNKKAWSKKPEKEWVRHACPRIVSDELWQEVNDLLAARKRAPVGRPAVHLFAGILRCECGGKMYVPSKQPSVYRCWNCRRKILVEDLEHLYREELASFFVDEEEVASRLLEADQAITGKMDLLDSRLKERSRLEREVDKLYALFQGEHIDERGFGAKYAPLSQQLHALDEEIPRLQAEIDLARMSLLSQEEVQAGAKDLYGRWPQLTQSEKRAIIEAITEEIEVGDGEITISLLQTSSPQMAYKDTRPQGFIAATSWNRAG
jgi:site-specific DNA recombinase